MRKPDFCWLLAIISVAFAPSPAFALFPGQDKFDQCLAVGYMNDSQMCVKVNKFSAGAAFAEHDYKATFSDKCHAKSGFSKTGDQQDIMARMTALLPRTKGCSVKIVDPDGPPD